MRFILGALTGIVFLMAGAVVYTALNPLPPARTSAPEATAQTAATGSVDAPVPSGTLSGAMPEAAAGAEEEAPPASCMVHSGSGR